MKLLYNTWDSWELNQLCQNIQVTKVLVGLDCILIVEDVRIFFFAGRLFDNFTSYIAHRWQYCYGIM